MTTDSLLKYLFYTLSLLVTFAVSKASADNPQVSWQSTSLRWEKELEVELYHRRRCGISDFDLALYDLKYHLEDPLFLTIEPIWPPRSFPVMSRLVQLDTTKIRETNPEAVLSLANEIIDGSNFFSFDPPRLTQLTLAGIFLCRDATKTGSCQNQRYGDPRTLLNQYNTAENPSELYGEGRIYFFKPFLINNNVIHLPSGITDPKDRDVVKVYWQALVNTFDSAAMQNNTTNQSAIDYLIWNAPLTQRGSALRVSMGYSAVRAQTMDDHNKQCATIMREEPWP